MIDGSDSEETCAFCKCLLSSSLDWDPSEEDQHFFFHAECASCPPQEDDHLCAFCRHLRLQHLISCPDNEISWSSIDLGSFSDVQSRRRLDCAFCDLVASCVDSYLTLHIAEDIPSSVLTFALEFFKPEFEYHEPAKILLKVFDEGDDVVCSYWAMRGLPKKQMATESASPLGLVTPQIPWERVKKWITACEDHHEGCALSSQNALPPGFRVIDVSKRQLVRPKHHCSYVALSYVWGKNPDPSKLLANMANASELEIEGALRSPMLPATIEEAMQACQKLGERYLWADRLCIVQDDPVNKKQQIESMVDIYSQANFVMAVVGSNSVDDPIPGIANPRAYGTAMVKIGSLQILSALPAFPEAVLSSLWASRGWTYQEAVLCKRKLYLTPSQLIYECQVGHIYEDNLLNEDPWDSLDVPCAGDYQRRMPHLGRRGETSMTLFESYSLHVGEYNDRSLTYVTDIYNGFEGIASALYGNPAACYFGLPKADLSQALLWYALDSTDGRIRESTKVLMPSWSWSSASGPLRYLFKDTFCGSVVSWNTVEGAEAGLVLRKVNEGESVSEYWDRVYELENEKLINNWLCQAPHIVLAIATEEGCVSMNRSWQSILRKSHSFLDVGRALFKQWPHFSALHRDLATPPVSDPITGIEVGTLVGRVQVATLKIAAHRSHGEGSWECSRAGDWCEIRDNSGRPIGMLAPSPSMPPLKEAGMSIELIGISVAVLSSTNFHPELICLMPDRGDEVMGIPTSEVYRKAKELRHLELSYCDVDGEMLWPAPVINVMMIQRQGTKCRRVSVGWVLMTRWGQLERTWETIYLV